MAIITEPVIYNGPLNVPRLCLRGDGPVGNDPTGPQLIFAHAGDGIVLGQSDPFRATGGILADFKVIKGHGFNGGTAIYAEARNLGERPGELDFLGLNIMGESDLDGGPLARWARGFVLSALTLTATNAAGLRVCRFSGGRIAGCTDDSIRLENAVHCWIYDTQVDPGPSGIVPIVRIVGGAHIFLRDNNITGTIIVEGNASDVIISGWAQEIIIRSGCRNVVIDGIIERRLTIEQGATGRSRAVVPNVVNRSMRFSIDRF